MPTYEYRCESCKERFEEEQKITAAPLKVCPKCGKESLKRGPGGGIGLIFKGSGFYKTDYDNSIKPEEKPASTKSDSCCPCGKNSESCTT